MYRKNLRNTVLVSLVLLGQFCFGQVPQDTEANPTFFLGEINLGKTMEANTDFPDTRLQKGFFLGIGRYNHNSEKEWASRLNFPKTGLLFGYTDFGNTDAVGTAVTFMPYLEFTIFRKYVKNLNLQIGTGVSYTDTKYDPESNPFNRAVTTDLNWAFRAFFYYDLLRQKSKLWRFGLGYLHHSNGHTRLPNQGLNSFVGSISMELSNPQKESESKDKPKFSSKSETFFTVRTGIGQNVLSEVFNDKKEVYAFAASMGKIINNTFKIGGGFYYRFYEHYYDYIKNNEALVEEQLPHFRDNPFGYATNFGLFATTELLIDHFGIEFDIGINIYKPFYKIDWQLNQGYSFENAQGETVEVLGELDWYYEIKRTVSSRLGLKYYFWTTNKRPKHNLFIGAHINANLGQADFTELSVGYMYRFNFKEKKK